MQDRFSIPLIVRSTVISDEEKKKGAHEKPESHQMEGEDLEDVSGGTGDSFICLAGDAVSLCVVGGGATGGGCKAGDQVDWRASCMSGPAPSPGVCAVGGTYKS